MAESQLRKGALELVVLGLLAAAPTYGGALLEQLRETAGLAVSQGTLYPLLSRLYKSKMLRTRWEESPTGPPRKIYEITPAGEQRLATLTKEWKQLTAAVAATTKGARQ